jgi:hypothetical protein
MLFIRERHGGEAVETEIVIPPFTEKFMAIDE